MNSRTINRFAGRLLRWMLLLCVGAYGLQWVTVQMVWLFPLSLILLFWAVIAWVFSTLDVLTCSDEW